MASSRRTHSATNSTVGVGGSVPSASSQSEGNLEIGTLEEDIDTQPHLYIKNVKLRTRGYSTGSGDMNLSSFDSRVNGDGSESMQDKRGPRKSGPRKSLMRAFSRKSLHNQSFRNDAQRRASGTESISASQPAMNLPLNRTKTAYELGNATQQPGSATSASDHPFSSHESISESRPTPRSSFVLDNHSAMRMPGLLGRIVHRMSTWFVTNHYPYSDEPIKAWKSLAGEYFVCCCDMLSELVDQLSLALDDAHTRDTPVPKFSNQRSKPYGYTYTYTYTYTFLTGSGLEMALSGLRLGFMALDKTVPCARSVLKMLLDVLRMWCCTQPYPFTDEPIRAWQVIEPLLNMRELRIPDVKSLRTVSPGLFRLVVISDTHGRPVKDLPPGDIIIHAGDFTMCGDTKEVKEFANWFGGLDYKHRIVVAGNHEITFDIEGYEQLWRDKHKMKRHHRNIKKSLVEHEGITYLEDSGVDINGYKFWGSPWQPKFCEWAFQRKRGKALKSIWDAIPRDVDVLITHSPPVGMGDLTTRKERAGCVDLLYAVQKQIKPLYHLFGHVHEGYGMWSDGTTVFANASTCNHRYQVANAPIVFDLPYPVEPMAMSTSADLGTGREMDRAERLGSQSTSRGSSASLSGTGLQETLLVIQRSATSLRARAASAGGDTPGRLSPIRQKTGAPYMSRIEQSVYSVDAPFTAKTEQSVDSPEVTKIEQTVDLPAVPTNGEATGPSANTATITTTVTHTETTTTTTTENNTEVTNANTNTTITRSHTHTHTPTPAHAVGSPAHMHTNGNTSNTVMDSLTPDTRRRSRPHSPLARVRVAAVRKFSLSSKRATYPDGTPRGSTSNSPGSTRGTLPREGIGRDDKGLARNYSGGSNIIIRSTRTQGSPSEGKWRSKGKELAQKMLGRRQSYESNMNGSNQTLGIDDAYRGVRRQVSSPVGSVDGLRKVKPDGSPLDGDYEED